ncbi:hypothetical protein LUZ60_005707 [Juncus effusus]|nr:hypothetical protein LUZ60_005707 [Juncus effusus]
MEKLCWGFPDGNISDLVDSRRIDSLRDTSRKLQFHSSLVRRLALERQMEGHSGCVNAIAWNSKGSLLVSGSDDTRINIWNYEDRKLKHSIETGHTANIFCTKFLPETSDEVLVSGAGDAEVRVFNLSRSSSTSQQNLSPIPSALYRCHTRRVKKLAVEAGNPHVVWSASEDGTMRQHDFRERSSCPPAGAASQECRNILIDLRNGAKKSLGMYPKNCLLLKSCDISPTRPHLILIGGSDAFGRLYDRRMLPPLSSCRISSRPPPCVAYFCPVHLSEHRKSSLHLTHVGFSPNGEEVLMSYSGEHVYLMDVNADGNENTMRYSVGDIKKHLYLPSFPSVPEISSFKPSTKKSPSKSDLKRVELRKKLGQVASKCLERERGSDYLLHGIEACNEVLDGKYYDSDPLLRLDCFCIRAALFLKRKWKNDVYMAIRDCNNARVLDGSSFKANYYMAEALLQLGRLKEALEYANAADFLTDSKSEFTRKIQVLKEKIATAETQKNKRKQEESSTRHTARRARLRSLSDMLISPPHADVSNSNTAEGAEEDENGTDIDADGESENDNEMEFEFETENEDENESENERVVRGSLNVRIHRNGDSVSDQDSFDDDYSAQSEIAIDMKQRYVGHCNVGTDIKQASFLGQKGEFVASGSDDGKWFIWEKQTGRLVKMLIGDDAVVNCIQAHPFDCAVATSGIDNTIKMWTPSGEVPSMTAGGVVGPESSDVLQAIKGNQRQLSNNREVMLPLELLERFHMHEFAQSFECTQS